MSFSKRFAHVRTILGEGKYFTKNGISTRQIAYWIGQELDLERSRGLRTIAPNERGLILAARIAALQFYTCLAVYLFTGAFEERFD